MRHTPLASCFRDAAPRTTEAWMDLGFRFDLETPFHLSPEGFRKVLKQMRQMTETLPENAWGKKLFVIDNWNEWDEGHYVSPCHEHGFKYLQAIREELTQRDNLPDYRTPQDLGFTTLNKSWDIPDLGNICNKRLNIKK